MTPSYKAAVILALLAGVVASALMLLAVSTDHWEVAEYDTERLKAVANVNVNASYFDADNGFYKLVVMRTELTKSESKPAVASSAKTESSATSSVANSTVHYLRANYGGIWRICDRVSESFRLARIYREAMEGDLLLRYTCFNYIPDYGVIRDKLHPNGVSLVRMQNSAASCNIVSVMCLVTAAVIGSIGLWRKQVSACMVTGVMYIVAGVFGCFSLIIMLTKVNYMQRECYSLNPLDSNEICHCRHVTTGWSVTVAWFAFTFFLVAFACWLLLSRIIRLEKAKSVI